MACHDLSSFLEHNPTSDPNIEQESRIMNFAGEKERGPQGEAPWPNYQVGRKGSGPYFQGQVLGGATK